MNELQLAFDKILKSVKDKKELKQEIKIIREVVNLATPRNPIYVRKEPTCPNCRNDVCQDICWVCGQRVNL